MSSVRDSVKRDLEATTSMSALVLEQVLTAADDAGVAVAVDMSKTEDAGVCCSPAFFRLSRSCKRRRSYRSPAATV